MPDPVTPPAPPEPPPNPTPPSPPPAPDPLGDAGKRALDAEREARRVAEKAARDAQTELDALKATQLSEQDKAIADAKAQGRNDAAPEIAKARLDAVAARMEAALTGVVPDPEATVKLLDKAPFLKEDGSTDSDALKALRKHYEELGIEPSAIDLGQGGRGNKNAKPSVDAGREMFENRRAKPKAAATQ